MTTTAHTPMSLGRIRIEHPFPWSYQAEHLGRIRVFDVSGREVPLLVMLDYVLHSTQEQAQKP